LLVILLYRVYVQSIPDIRDSRKSSTVIRISSQISVSRALGLQAQLNSKGSFSRHTGDQRFLKQSLVDRWYVNVRTGSCRPPSLYCRIFTVTSIKSCSPHPTRYQTRKGRTNAGPNLSDKLKHLHTGNPTRERGSVHLRSVKHTDVNAQLYTTESTLCGSRRSPAPYGMSGIAKHEFEWIQQHQTLKTQR